MLSSNACRCLPLRNPGLSHLRLTAPAFFRYLLSFHGTITYNPLNQYAIKQRLPLLAPAKSRALTPLTTLQQISHQIWHRHICPRPAGLYSHPQIKNNTSLLPAATQKIAPSHRGYFFIIFSYPSKRKATSKAAGSSKIISSNDSLSLQNIR